MLRSLIAAALALAVMGSVATVAPAKADALVTKATRAGPITVNLAIADRMVGFVNDAHDRGFRGRVHCWSAKYDRHGRRTHVENSRHYSGNACDFAQHFVRGRDGRRHIGTHRVMYRVADLARKWGFRDGCTFRDCGHIDQPRPREHRARRTLKKKPIRAGRPALTRTFSEGKLRAMVIYHHDPEHEFLKLVDFFENIPLEAWADKDQKAMVEALAQCGVVRYAGECVKVVQQPA